MNARPGAWAPVGQEGSHRRRKGSGYFDTTRKIPLEAIGFYGSGSGRIVLAGCVGNFRNVRNFGSDPSVLGIGMRDRREFPEFPEFWIVPPG